MNSKQKKQLYRHFKKCVEKWVNFFGLTEYRINVESIYEQEEFYAEVRRSVSGGSTDFYINLYAFEGMEDDKALNQIDKSAFHEVCHLLLARMSTYARERYTTPEQLMESEEMIIRRLENTVYPLLKK